MRLPLSFGKYFFPLARSCFGQNYKAHFREMGFFYGLLFTPLFPIQIGNFRIILKSPFSFMEQGIFGDGFFVFFHFFGRPLTRYGRPRASRGLFAPHTIREFKIPVLSINHKITSTYIKSN